MFFKIYKLTSILETFKVILYILYQNNSIYCTNLQIALTKLIYNLIAKTPYVKWMEHNMYL